MNNVSTAHSGAVSSKNLAWAVLAGKQIYPIQNLQIDKPLIIKITTPKEKKRLSFFWGSIQK